MTDAETVWRRIAAVHPEDAATIVYTSGTTGPPKGCVSTHANLLATVGMYESASSSSDRGVVIYLFLPLAHSLARVAQLVALEVGGTLAFWGGDPKRIVDELAEVRPTHFPSVPRVFEKVHTAVAERRRGAGPASSSAIFDWALARSAPGTRAPSARRRGPRPSAAARHRLADRLVLSKVRGVFGDRLQRRDDRRRADRPRGARVLRRLRGARARGLRDDRDVRGRDAQHAGASCASARVGRRCPAPRWRSPTTARS